MDKGDGVPAKGGALEVLVLNRQRRRKVSPMRLRRVLLGAARALRVSGEVALVLTGNRTIRPLNARYRGKDKATDVLSFPGPGGDMGLGDILISVEMAERNAASLGRTLARELDVLALHGFLHVLGYDHETDDGTMDRLERRLRRRLLGSGGVTIALAAIVFLVLSVLSVAIATVEAAFFLIRRRRISQRELPENRAELVNGYLQDPPTFLMPAHMGTYTAHVGMTICVTSVLVEHYGAWSLVVAFLVMMIYLLACRLTLPYALARRNPELVLGTLLPLFDVYARWLSSLVAVLRQRTEPEPEPLTETPDRKEPPAPPALEQDENRLIDAVSRFSTRHVRDVMTPRPDIVSLPADGTVEDLRKRMTESRYSRIPISGENLDDIVGIVTVRDVVAFTGDDKEPLRPLAREVLLVPETKKLVDLLRDFQQKRTTFAVVIDEYGGTAGLVSMEDIVEEIVGDIADEFDVETEPIQMEGDGVVVVSGRASVERLEGALGTKLSEGDVDTVGGLVSSVFGRIPRPGERADWKGYTLEVLDAERKRVNRVRFRRHAAQASA